MYSPKPEDRVKIINFTQEMNGIEGVVSSRDGDYIMVRVFIGSTKEHEVELYACEVELIKQ